MISIDTELFQGRPCSPPGVVTRRRDVRHNVPRISCIATSQPPQKAPIRRIARQYLWTGSLMTGTFRTHYGFGPDRRLAEPP